MNSASATPSLNLRSILSRRSGFLFGMSAAFRVPLRAFANPATRQTSRASIAGFSLPQNVLRSSSFSGAIAPRSWSRHSYDVRPRPTLSRSFSTRTSPLWSAETKQAKSAPSQRKPIALLIVLGLLGVGAAVYSEELKHGYGAARRSGRVVGTLAVCINE